MNYRTGSRKIVANAGPSSEHWGAQGFTGKHWPSGERVEDDRRGFGNPAPVRAPEQPRIYEPGDEGKEEPMEAPHRTARDLYE